MSKTFTHPANIIPGQWEYLSCSCLVDLGVGLRVCITQQCALCGNTNLRFTHTLVHLDDEKKQICVGIECATALMEGSDIPRLAENETKRKESWRRYYRKPGRCSTCIEDLEARGRL